MMIMIQKWRRRKSQKLKKSIPAIAPPTWLIINFKPTNHHMLDANHWHPLAVLTQKNVASQWHPLNQVMCIKWDGSNPTHLMMVDSKTVTNTNQLIRWGIWWGIPSRCLPVKRCRLLVKLVQINKTQICEG